jgi:hypothetical protein
MISGTEGPYRLAAVLAGFQLLNTALQYDMGAAEAINSMTVRERVAPLHMQLVNPQRRLAVLLQYVLYPNMDLQYEVGTGLGVWQQCVVCRVWCVAWALRGHAAQWQLGTYCCWHICDICA